MHGINVGVTAMIYCRIPVGCLRTVDREERLIDDTSHVVSSSPTQICRDALAQNDIGSFS